jgi:secreted trypsin-like serine protease
MKRHSYVVAMAAVAWLGCQAQEEEAAVQGSEVLSNEQEIIGGTPASLGQFPWQARLTDGASHICGGSLIHPSWVLTTATCVTPYPDPADMRVILGDLQFNQTEPMQQVHSVSRFVVHPDYNVVSGVPVNDLALIRLSTPATLNSAVQTIALQSATASNTLHTVSGWGWEDPADYHTSNTLMYASIPVTSNASCDGAPLSRDLFPGELCAGYLNGAAGGCHGDVGGPLVTQGSPAAAGGDRELGQRQL